MVAAASVAAGWVLRLALNDLLDSTVPYLTLFPAVMFAAWFGGLGPSILAAILSVIVASFFLIPPFYHSAVNSGWDVVRTFLFLVFSIFIGTLVDALKRSWREVERTRDLLHTTLSSIGDGVIAADADGKVTFLNTVAEKLTGWSQADANGRPIAEVFAIRNESTGVPVEDPIAVALRDRTVVSLANHTILIDKAGHSTPIEDSAAPILDPNQQLFGVVLVFRDVSARRQTENTLNDNQERLKLALDAGKIGAWDWSLKQNRIEWSDHVYEIHRIDRTAFSGRIDDYEKLVHPEDRDRVQQAIDAALHRNAPYDLSFRIVRPTGEVRWISAMARVVRDEQGAPVRMLGAVTDITDQKQTEAHLQRQWSAFDTALSNTPDHYFILDGNGRLIYANSSLLTLWQRTLKDSIGKDFFELDYPAELAARVVRQTQEVILARQSVRDQMAFAGPSGESRNYDYILVPAFAADGQVEAVAGSSRDITDRIRSEQALRESEERLHFALEAGGGVGTWDWDIPADRVHTNAAFASLFRVDPGSAASGSPAFLEAVHPDDRGRVTASIRKASKSGGNFAEEFRVCHSEGVRWVYARGRCHMDEAGNPVRFLGVVFDITDRRNGLLL